MSYRHTQKGPWYLLLLAIACVMVVGAVLERVPAFYSALVGCIAGLFVILALSFRYMTVSDQGDELSIRFGPLPLIQKRIAYNDISAVEADRTSLIDGWGMHWVPMRGWTYNIWGFRCVKLHCGNRIIRVGSDDVENLLPFLQSRIIPQVHRSMLGEE